MTKFEEDQLEVLERIAEYTSINDVPVKNELREISEKLDTIIMLMNQVLISKELSVGRTSKISKKS